MSRFGMTKRLTSLFLCLLLVFSITFTTVSASELDNKNYVTLDKYSFLETVCGMFNSFYAPDGFIDSPLNSWSNITTHSTAFDYVLRLMNKTYIDSISTLGYQSTDSLSSNYVRPYFYSTTSSELPNSIYQSFLDNGCLDFISVLNENEYNLIKHSYNRVFKLMYDYNYNDSELDLSILSYFDKLLVYSTSYGTSYIGYDFPRNSFASTLDGQVNALRTQSEYVLSNNLTQDDYISVSGHGTGANLAYTLITTTNHSSLDGIKYRYEINPSAPNSITMTGTVTFHTFSKVTLEDGTFDTSLNSKTSFENGSTLTYSKSNKTVDYVSPKIDYYSINISSSIYIHNWGKDLIVGSNSCWDTFNYIKDTTLDIYYPPTEEDISDLVYYYYYEDDYEIILDDMTGVFTGTQIVDPPSDGGTSDEVGNFDDSNSELKDKFDQYKELEDQLVDYTNLDSAFETFLNTNNIVENAESLAGVSNYFMILWDSFGPFGVVLTTSIALGLVSFLLNL